METVLYFSDNFFSAGLTDIYNEKQEIVGQLNLKSIFSSSLEVLNESHEPVATGRFAFFTNRWIVEDGHGRELGILRPRFSFFSKRYEYRSHEHGTFRIHSEAFSRHYEIFNEKKEKVAEFDKISGIFSAPAFRLQNWAPIRNEEWIAVVMGVSMIQRRISSQAANAHPH